MTGNTAIALGYARRGLPVFPMVRTRDGRRVPTTEHGYKDASTDPATITGWWSRRPGALVSMPTGKSTGIIVLDVDVKNGFHGWAALEELNALPMPETPHAHTPSGGCHIYFAAPDFELRNSTSRLGAGLDIRGDGGSIILPAPIGGYAWDPRLSLDTVLLAPLPLWLIEAACRVPEPIEAKVPDYLLPGLSRYGRAALDGAGRDIMAAPAGKQESTLNGRAFWIGRLVAGGEIPLDLARDALVYAASRMVSHDPHNPWRPADVIRKVSDSIAAGMKKPFVPAKERSHA